LFTLEPFEEMTAAVLEKAEPLVAEKWGRLTLHSPRWYAYPPLSWLQWTGYLIASGYATFLFALAPLLYGHVEAEWLLYWIGAILVISPWFIRDLRRSRQRLVLTNDGIRLLRGRTTQPFPWEEIKRIEAKEDAIFIGGPESRRLRIPLRMQRCGELLFFLRTRCDAEIVDRAS
jgi:hypothetical protein